LKDAAEAGPGLKTRNTMLYIKLPKLKINARLRDAAEADVPLFNEVIGSLKHTESTARLAQLIRSGASTDAALALIDLELPMWQVRRLAYDDGEWYCALSRERELPDWLDQSIETRHAELALAILCAFVEARRVSTPESRTSVPDARGYSRDFYETLPIDNYV
jgi:hypothetical protein